MAYAKQALTSFQALFLNSKSVHSTTGSHQNITGGNFLSGTMASPKSDIDAADNKQDETVLVRVGSSSDVEASDLQDLAGDPSAIVNRSDSVKTGELKSGDISLANMVHKLSSIEVNDSTVLNFQSKEQHEEAKRKTINEFKSRNQSLSTLNMSNGRSYSRNQGSHARKASL